MQSDYTRKILDAFFHRQGEKRILHGAVLTDRRDYDHYKLIKKWYLRGGRKSASVVDEAIKYITELGA